ncbi:uncharacterized protein LOC110452751 isoform X2 [Mizuhopecten yessoensis]|uniref:uncharacterized protein LOC110452751 isoform X2 n=1 Tax=Mizuhopecten yessoensis TaxID=6573 RepID=UPI000B45C983|nr:uncharacterized protein LOC110452751 isoform X2 [Mizuhopecten yessoensis]
MARLEAGKIVVLTAYYIYYFHCCCGNWTWSEAYYHCRGRNLRLAYKDEITAQVNMSETEIMEDDVLFWINDNMWPSEPQYPCGCLETSEVDGNAVFESDECAMCCKDVPLFALKDFQCLCKVNITGPLNCTTCADPDKYHLYKHIEPKEQCLLMYGALQTFVFNAKFVNCTMKAGIMCRTAMNGTKFTWPEAQALCLNASSKLVNLNMVSDLERNRSIDEVDSRHYWANGVVKHGKAGQFQIVAMNGTKFTWPEAQALCLNASSKLVNLNMVSDLERNRSIDVVDSRHYWANGVVKHGQAGQFQIEDCIESSGMLGTDPKFAQHHWNSVYSCHQMCKGSGRIALMGEQCRCLMADENVTDSRTSGCTTPCVGNTRDRCGGNNSYSIYRQILREETQQSDDCSAITKNSDNNITTNWQTCRQRLDGCICRNGTIDTSYVINRGNITWAEAQVECEYHNMMLATFETSPIAKDQLSDLQEGATLWTGVYSPTVLEFNSSEIQDDDKCLSVTNFKKSEYNTEEKDCNQLQGVICHNDEGVLRNITTLPYDDMMSDSTSPDVTTGRMTTVSIIATITSSPYTGMSPMIIGLICTVVLVGLVLAVILGVLTVLLYRFKEQKRQLNMLKGPTISYSNLEHSIVVSYGVPSNEDSGEDIGNLDNITEQMDAQFMRKDEQSPDEKSEHLYDISDNVDNKNSIKSENGILNARGKTFPEPDDDAYTEVELCAETGNPTFVSNRKSGSLRSSSSSGEVKNLKISKNEERTPLLKVTEKCNESVDKDKNESTDKETFNDDDYDDADSCVRHCSTEIDMDTYDEFENKSRKRPRSNTDCFYDRVTSDSYDEIKTGVAAKGKIHYEEVDLNFSLPS